MNGDCFKRRPVGEEGEAEYSMALVKWEAWEAQRGMSRDDSMRAYVQLVDSISTDWGAEVGQG